MTENIPQAAQELRSIVDRIVRLETERKELGGDVKDIYTEAKSRGYNAAALRKLVKKQLETDKQREKREQVESDMDVMEAALGTYITTPLGEAAMRSVS